MIYGTLFKG